MFTRRDTEVVVVGAGPVGLYAAVLLAELGIRVRVIDEAFRETTRSYALALHPHSLERLDEIGLATELVHAGQRLDKVAFYGEGTRQAEVDYSALASRFPYVLVLPQSTLETALTQALAEKGVTVDWSHRLVGLELGEGSASLTVQKLAKESLGYATSHTEWVVERESNERVAFVIGADGHRSRTRRELGISFETVAAPQLFAILEFYAERPATTPELQVVLDERTSVLWPLGGNRFRWSFEVAPDYAPESAREKSRLMVVVGQQAFTCLDVTQVRELMEARAPWSAANGVGEVAWSLAARFESRLASELGKGSAWLAGDAAHLAPPMAVHSMNAGLAEARELCLRIEAALRQGGRRDELAAFAGRWSRDVRRMFSLQVRCQGQNTDQNWLRDHASRLAACLPASGDHQQALLAQLGLAYA